MADTGLREAREREEARAGLAKRIAEAKDPRTKTAAYQKYLLLGRELEAMPRSIDRDNALHTHSKLGIFLTTEYGDKWKWEDS